MPDSMKDRIHDELVTSYDEPDGDRLVAACEGIVGIYPDTHHVRPLWNFDELTASYRVIAYLLAAWAAMQLGETTGTVPESELLELDGVGDSVLASLDDEWIVREGQVVWLRREMLVTAVDRLLEEYQEADDAD